MYIHTHKVIIKCQLPAKKTATKSTLISGPSTFCDIHVIKKETVNFFGMRLNFVSVCLRTVKAVAKHGDGIRVWCTSTFSITMTI